jgi:hypothetical protein
MVIDEEAVKVIDEDNEATIYPSAFFLRVEFPPAIERALYDLGGVKL